MNSKVTRSGIAFVITVMLLLSSLSLAQDPDTRAQKPCSQPQARQFDFWIGEWELSWPEGQMGTSEGQEGKGRNVIHSILGSCVIEENFTTADGSFVGKSWSVYDPQSEQWKQTWVDNSGGYLLFTGQFKDGKMELRTAPFQRSGKTLISRMIFENITEHSLDWSWQRSEDQGETWADLWNIHYSRKKPD